jgi:4-phospho-D-threonate 3-dehydrogenase / 4-phospho-D-erythronate 3-dehydrogenase
MTPRLVISAGDPAGIGPEIVLKALVLAPPRVPPLVAGHPGQLAETAGLLGLAPLPAGDVIAAGDASGIAPGEVCARSGRAAADSVRAALAAIDDGQAAALVTAPIAKSALRAAGYDWAGQTEMLADLCGARDLHVLLAGGGLHVVHVTAHRSLADAVAAVTPARVRRAIGLAAEHARRLGRDAPRIAVAGLNPHAGEGGLLGDEERTAIAPAVAEARDAGIDATGPLSADTLFPLALRGDFDVVVAMYHDQGHVPVKLLAGGAAVAMTLGLPLIRTSAEHGAAPDIAGRGIADASSMSAAIELADRLSA